ncbi:hypothetical protein Ae201684_005687 [Aphanomyces euteiches]|uniref:Uncharacterized protein n=1 Tax=Aphanomyces euteiches TaxID=100861 RepID=A0A6G0XEF7_9STRA|nr:hypothetical protein Ae201684_005687 [Aphanomyces euteiches]
MLTPKTRSYSYDCVDKPTCCLVFCSQSRKWLSKSLGDLEIGGVKAIAGFWISILAEDGGRIQFHDWTMALTIDMESLVVKDAIDSIVRTSRRIKFYNGIINPKMSTKRIISVAVVVFQPIARCCCAHANESLEMKAKQQRSQ